MRKYYQQFVPKKQPTFLYTFISHYCKTCVKVCYCCCCCCFFFRKKIVFSFPIWFLTRSQIQQKLADKEILYTHSLKDCYHLFCYSEKVKARNFYEIWLKIINKYFEKNAVNLGKMLHMKGWMQDSVANLEFRK